MTQPSNANSSVILDAVFNLLHNNNDLKQFCFSEFQSVGSVQLGLDPANAPDPEDLPAVVIGPVQRADKGEGSKTLDFLIFVSVSVTDITVDKTSIDNSPPLVADKIQGKKKYQGMVKAEELRELVEDIIISMDLKPSKKEVSGGSLPQNDFPIFRSTSAVSFSFPASYRGQMHRQLTS